jgi:hypothetical protein
MSTFFTFVFFFFYALDVRGALFHPDAKQRKHYFTSQMISTAIIIVLATVKFIIEHHDNLR